MEKDRLTALTDGVVAVIITLMVLDLKVPAKAEWPALAALWPTFLSYVLSFTYVAIYWNNHHHFFQMVTRVTGAVLWANLHLLFWLSMIPFATAWMGEHMAEPAPTALYGVSLLAPAIAWVVLQTTLIKAQGTDERLKRAIGPDLKGRASPFLYLLGICLSFLAAFWADVIYALVAALWLIPDRRIETMFEKDRSTAS